MDWIEATGLFGSFLTSITFIPQVYKTWQTKKAGDLSLSMLLIVLTSCCVWMVYGVALNLRPVIIANGIIGGLSVVLIYFKLTFKQ
jgi:MtN3 and saliva related transmembrane protein